MTNITDDTTIVPISAVYEGGGYERPTTALRFVERRKSLDGLDRLVLQQKWIIETAQQVREEWRDVPIETEEG